MLLDSALTNTLEGNSMEALENLSNPWKGVGNLSRKLKP